jgi:hypothetical protein
MAPMPPTPHMPSAQAASVTQFLHPSDSGVVGSQAVLSASRSPWSAANAPLPHSLAEGTLPHRAVQQQDAWRWPEGWPSHCLRCLKLGVQLQRGWLKVCSSGSPE